MSDLGRNPIGGLIIEFLSFSTVMYPWYFVFKFQVISPPYFNAMVLVFNIFFSIVLFWIQLGWGAFFAKPIWHRIGFGEDKASKHVAESFSLKDEATDVALSLSKDELLDLIMKYTLKAFHEIEMKIDSDLKKQKETRARSERTNRRTKILIT